MKDMLSHFFKETGYRMNRKEVFYMKKVIGIIIAIIGVIIAGFGISMKQKEAMAISIIGGADGPTSIFLAGKLGTSSFVGIMVVAVILLAIGVILVIKKKK